LDKQKLFGLYDLLQHIFSQNIFATIKVDRLFPFILCSFYSFRPKESKFCTRSFFTNPGFGELR